MEHDEITAAEAAAMIGVSPTHVRWYHRQGLLSGRRIGQRLLVFRLADVKEFKKPKKTGRPRKSPAKRTKKGGASS
jgi:hypothetical protein